MAKLYGSENSKGGPLGQGNRSKGGPLALLLKTERIKKKSLLQFLVKNKTERKKLDKYNVGPRMTSIYLEILRNKHKSLTLEGEISRKFTPHFDQKDFKNVIKGGLNIKCRLKENIPEN
jgi:hypothetical protein